MKMWVWVRVRVRVWVEVNKTYKGPTVHPKWNGQRIKEETWFTSDFWKGSVFRPFWFRDRSDWWQISNRNSRVEKKEKNKDSTKTKGKDKGKGKDKDKDKGKDKDKDKGKEKDKTQDNR